MTIQELEYIIALHRYKQFAVAAEHCHVTQPTLSWMIQKLEDELGVKLFDRKKQPICARHRGEDIVEQAWQVQVGARRIKEMVEEDSHSLLGTFKVGVLPTVAPYLVPRFFPQLMGKYPDMDITITEMQTEHIKKAFRHNDIDAGIVATIDGLSEFDSTTLYYEQFFAYVAKGDKLFLNESIHTSDLSGEYLWLLDKGHCFRDQLVKFCQLKAARRSRKAYNLGSIETFMRIVENGKGVTFIPELAIPQLSDEQRKLVRSFALPVPSREIGLLTGSGFIRYSLLNMLVEHIRSSVPAEMLKPRQLQQVVK